MRLEIRDIVITCRNKREKNGILFPVAVFSFIFTVLLLSSCQKTLHLKYDLAESKQVIISNLTPNTYLTVNISKSKRPDDFSSIDFLQDCNVELYENGVFRETLPFILKDTLSGLGYYTSTFKLEANKTYKIISTHAELPAAEATEYLPPIPKVENFALLQHADTAHPNNPGQYILVFQDSAGVKNYYFVSTYYRILKPTITNTGDTIYKYDYIGVASHAAEFPNLGNYGRSFTTDDTYDGQIKSFTVSFPSQYNNVYKEILLIIEISNLGKNYYDWAISQIPLGTDYLNEGQFERLNLPSNIINGYGHFTASSSFYIGIPIK